MDGERVVAALHRQALAGVRFEPVRFTPLGDVYARVSCGGVRFVVTDREAIRPVTVAFAVAEALGEVHRDQWRPESIQNLLVNRSTMWPLLSARALVPSAGLGRPRPQQLLESARVVSHLQVDAGWPPARSR